MTQKTRLQRRLAFYTKHFPGDLSGALATTITTLPMALAFGVASGAGPVAGLYGTICTGFFAALFGGCPPQISAPTSVTTALVTVVLARYTHNPALAFTVIMMAGLFQILFGWMKVGRYLALVPTPVTSGLMTGVGLWIMSIQLGRLFGYKAAATTAESFLSLGEWIRNPNGDAMIIAGVALAILLLVPGGWRRFLPPPLLALGVCGWMAATVCPNAPMVTSIPDVWPDIQQPAWTWADLPHMIQAALMIAGMSSVYTLIGALIADSALGTHHNTNRELIGQGVGNAVSGLMGGLAGTGTAVRTMVNIRNGGRTRASGIMSALMILGIVLGCGQHVNRVPVPLLAGLLIKAGWDIMDWSYLKTVRRTWPFERVLFIMIILLTLFADLLWAMGFGVTLAALWSVTTVSEVQKKHVFFREVDNVRAPAVRQPDATPQAGAVQPDAPVRSVSFQGALGYGFSIELAAVLGQCRHEPAVLLDWRHVTYMDTTIGLAFGRFFTQRKAAHRLTFVLLPSQEPLEAWIRALGILRAVPDPCVLNTMPSGDKAWATLIRQAATHAESVHQKGH